MTALYSMLAIALGATIGANMRWGLSLALNAYIPDLPPGTLAANLLGGFLIGLAIPLFSSLPQLSPFWKLFAVTGFLGALTTFSTFSSEIFGELQAGNLGWGLAGIIVHVGGSLGMTGLGIAVFALARRFLLYLT